MTAVATTGGQFNQTRGVMRFAELAQMGDVYFANSADSNGASSGGYCVDAPTATLIQAQSLCNARTNQTNFADFVYVGAGHAENIVGAAGMTFSKPGVTYVGQGVGRQRPTITFKTATTAQMIISGAGIKFQNMIFDFTGIDAIVAAILITAVDVAFEDCEFITNSATAGCVLGILTAATATRFRLTRCRFLGTAANSGTTTTAQVKHEVGENFVIENCHFEGKVTQNFLNATAIIAGLINYCTFHTFTGTKGISVHASTQALIANCGFCVASGAAPVVGTIVNVVKNAYTTEGVGVVAGTVTTF